MKWLLSLLLLPLFQPVQIHADILIRNGKIIDGTGNGWYYGDVAIKDGRIIRVGRLAGWNGARNIDATGLVVAPGFIDVHAHIEGDEVEHPEAANFIYDGVTTVVTGNCGSSRVNLAAYFSLLDSLKTSVNVAALIGHNDVRKAVMGRANRAPEAAELQQMKSLVEAAMQAGAVGFSTGLIYIPGTYAGKDEIVALARVAALYDGVYASHMRNEGDSVVQAIEEAIGIGRAAGLPVQLSHFKVSGQNNWGRSAQTLALVQAARNSGLDVTIDQYPYTASSTSLSTLLPDWVLADGQDSIVARLARPAVRKAVKAHMLAGLHKRRLKHFDYARVAYCRADTAFNGKSIAQVNRMLGRKARAGEEAETVLQLVEKGGASMVFHGMSEADVRYFVQYPFNMFASDASIRIFGQGVPHPRGYGTNARVLARYVREEKVLHLEEAIRRMTSLPAQKFGLRDRGLVREGMAADLVLFDEHTVQDNATFEKPHQYASGFRYVLVNGWPTIDGGRHTGARKGTVLKNAYVRNKASDTLL